MTDQKPRGLSLPWTRPVQAHLLQSAWSGGLEIKRKGTLSPQALTARGRFLLLAVERCPEIADDLFAKASAAFEQALAWIDARPIYADFYEPVLFKAKRFVEHLMSLPDEQIDDDAAWAQIDLSRRQAIIALSLALEQWANSWRLNGGAFLLDALGVLIAEKMQSRPKPVSVPNSPAPTLLVRPPAGHAQYARAWRRSVEDYLRAALEMGLTPGVNYNPDPGFELYDGRGRSEYVDRQKERAKQWIKNEMWVSPFAGLPVAMQKQMIDWVGEGAEKYCDRVDEELMKQGAESKRIEPKFARDLEWTVERRILNWDWEKIAEKCGVSVGTIKKGVRKILPLLGLPLVPSFEEKRGRRIKGN